MCLYLVLFFLLIFIPLSVLYFLFWIEGQEISRELFFQVFYPGFHIYNNSSTKSLKKSKYVLVYYPIFLLFFVPIFCLHVSYSTSMAPMWSQHQRGALASQVFFVLCI